MRLFIDDGKIGWNISYSSMIFRIMCIDKQKKSGVKINDYLLNS